jgi:hypothetical protein
MGDVRLIATHFVFNVDYNNVEYEVTCSQDLKSIYDVYPETENVTAILDIIQTAFLSNEIENFD